MRLDDVSIMKFIKYFKQADSISNLSKGRHTKVGCKIMTVDRYPLIEGYNGAPSGCNADEHNDTRSLKPEKYYWTCHAEENAIAMAARNGISLRDSVMVVTNFPCMRCARSMVQAGIRHVFSYMPTGSYLHTWSEDINRSVTLFHECGVELYIYDPLEASIHDSFGDSKTIDWDYIKAV